jgi:hypothetical protein
MVTSFLSGISCKKAICNVLVSFGLHGLLLENNVPTLDVRLHIGQRKGLEHLPSLVGFDQFVTTDIDAPQKGYALSN